MNMNLNTKAEVNFVLRELRAEYAFLQHQPASDLTGDERRGVEHYLADTGATTEHVTLRTWTRFIQQLDTFVARHGRLPRAANQPDVPVQEARLNQMLNTQRTPKVRAGLSSYQTRRLESIPGFAWKPRDTTWQTTFNDHQWFCNSRRHSPRLRSSNKTETALARWALAQRIAANNGTLPASHESVLWSAKYPVL